MWASAEHAEAVALCQWWAFHANLKRLDQRLLIHIPNEGKRTPWSGKRLKDEGLRPGTPDYFLAVARAPYHGLFIELKGPKGRFEASQKEMAAILGEQYYWADVCYGADQAIALIEKYLSWPGRPASAPSPART